MDRRQQTTAELLSVQPPGQKAIARADLTAAGLFLDGGAVAPNVLRSLTGNASTHDLLEAAMTLTLQGRNRALDGTEPISNWVNRIVTETPAEEPGFESTPAPVTLPPASDTPEDPGSSRPGDAVDGSQKSDGGSVEQTAWTGGSQVRWFLPIDTAGSWTESPASHVDLEHSGAMGD